MTMPMAKPDLLAGYGSPSAWWPTVQAVVTVCSPTSRSGWILRARRLGRHGRASPNALLGTALGLLLSAFARTEFQAVQFMPAFILPQILLCGLLVPGTRWPRRST